MRIMLKVAYDGTAYHGWQVQSHDDQTIEGVLNRALSGLCGENISVIGASRTDAGVHAEGNLCVFDTASSIPADRYVYAVNSILPPDIRVMESVAVACDFHPRHTESRKTYRYRILHADICPPNLRLYCHHMYGPLDTDAMKEACAYFIGEHDFASFVAAGSQALTTVRRIYELTVGVCPAGHYMTGTVGNEDDTARPDLGTEAGDLYCKGYGEYIDIRVTGSGFLYNMVRIIAGTLTEVGRGRMKPRDVERVIEARDRSQAGPTLPACGLTLERIEISDRDRYIKD